ncbi:glycine dehydrogenase [Marinomonas sp. MED121]|nr:glycine dehydrogenase [Marinomonas sp. MED121]
MILVQKMVFVYKKFYGFTKNKVDVLYRLIDEFRVRI